MTRHNPAQNLFDPRQGAEALCVRPLQHTPGPWEPERSNYFTIYHIVSGQGEFWADTTRQALAARSLLFFTPYQRIRIHSETELVGDVIQFHANFLCVETFHAESGCAGSLFNDPYHPPVVALHKDKLRREVTRLLQSLHQEQQTRDLGYEEILRAQLKILLVLATRQKSQPAGLAQATSHKVRHPALGPLKELIEAHYQTCHAPSDYAHKLHLSPKTLGRIVREQLGKSLTDLIRERILTHAKWQLLHTLKPVKEIAREVGFEDELYFSRLFKRATGYSPTFFRQFETEIRGGSNLSMFSSAAPILSERQSAENPAG